MVTVCKQSCLGFCKSTEQPISKNILIRRRRKKKAQRIIIPQTKAKNAYDNKKRELDPENCLDLLSPYSDS